MRTRYEKEQRGQSVKERDGECTHCSWRARRFGPGSPDIHRTRAGRRCRFRPSSGTRRSGSLGATLKNCVT